MEQFQRLTEMHQMDKILLNGQVIVIICSVFHKIVKYYIKDGDLVCGAYI